MPIGALDAGTPHRLWPSSSLRASTLATLLGNTGERGAPLSKSGEPIARARKRTETEHGRLRMGEQPCLGLSAAMWSRATPAPGERGHDVAQTGHCVEP